MSKLKQRVKAVSVYPDSGHLTLNITFTLEQPVQSVHAPTLRCA
jgi:hypothetical protein